MNIEKKRIENIVEIVFKQGFIECKSTGGYTNAFYTSPYNDNSILKVRYNDEPTTPVSYSALVITAIIERPCLTIAVVSP